MNSRGYKRPASGKGAQIASNVTLKTSLGVTRQDPEKAIATGKRKSSAGPCLPGQTMHNNQWSHIWKALNSLFQNLLP